ncbi:hypothetical protein ABPG75_000216 [Micractinium tetrahymenae]
MCSPAQWPCQWLTLLASPSAPGLPVSHMPASCSAPGLPAAGDSRCVLSKRGQARALTLDHKPILFEEAKRIIKVGQQEQEASSQREGRKKDAANAAGWMRGGVVEGRALRQPCLARSSRPLYAQCMHWPMRLPIHHGMPSPRCRQAGGFVRDNRINGALNVSRTIGDLDFKRNADLPHTEQMVGTRCWAVLEIKFLVHLENCDEHGMTRSGWWACHSSWLPLPSSALL